MACYTQSRFAAARGRVWPQRVSVLWGAGAGLRQGQAFGWGRVGAVSKEVSARPFFVAVARGRQSMAARTRVAKDRPRKKCAVGLVEK